MTLQTECINRLLDTIKGNFDSAILVTNTESNYASILGKTTSYITWASSHSGLGIPISWGSATSKKISTTNKADDSNALNFSIKAGVTANAIVFVNSSPITVDAIINLSVPKTGATTYGSGLYINKIDVTMTESA